MHHSHIFLAINTEQKTVPRSLVFDLYGIASESVIDPAAVRARDIATYLNEFPEPQVPKHFEMIIKSGLRQVIKEYLLDTSDLYLFDPDHAILAYPLRAIQIAYKKLLALKSHVLKSDEISYLCQLFSDMNGRPLPEIHKLLTPEPPEEYLIQLAAKTPRTPRKSKRK